MITLDFTDILTRHLTNVKEKIAQQMEANNRNTSGRSVASLAIEVIGNIGILYGAPQFAVMERGRKPGAVPSGFVGIIKQWIKDKGIAITPIPSKSANAKYSPEERGLNSMAGAIAYSIFRHGTRLHKDNGYNDIYTSVIDEELKLMADEMLVFISSSIKDINEGLDNDNI